MDVIRKYFAATVLVAVLLVPTIANAVAVSGQGTWETTLLGRDLDGNTATAEAYYDTVLNITWLADANINGLMTWASANTWANDLTLGGYTDWRLPTVTDSGEPGCLWSNTGGTDCGYNMDTSTGEMASLFYDTLGNLAYYDTNGDVQPGFGMSNTGLFTNIKSYYYWSATEYAPSTIRAWYFNTYDGKQSYNGKSYSYYAWAVHDGDVGASVVPVPAAVWLFGSGLIGLVGFARRKKI